MFTPVSEKKQPKALINTRSDTEKRIQLWRPKETPILDKSATSLAYTGVTPTKPAWQNNNKTPEKKPSVLPLQGESTTKAQFKGHTTFDNVHPVVSSSSPDKQLTSLPLTGQSKSRSTFTGLTLDDFNNNKRSSDSSLTASPERAKLPLTGQSTTRSTFAGLTIDDFNNNKKRDNVGETVSSSPERTTLPLTGQSTSRSTFTGLTADDFANNNNNNKRESPERSKKLPLTGHSTTKAAFDGKIDKQYYAQGSEKVDPLIQHFDLIGESTTRSTFTGLQREDFNNPSLKSPPPPPLSSTRTTLPLTGGSTMKANFGSIDREYYVQNSPERKPIAEPTPSIAQRLSFTNANETPPRPSPQAKQPLTGESTTKATFGSPDKSFYYTPSKAFFLENTKNEQRASHPLVGESEARKAFTGWNVVTRHSLGVEMYDDEYYQILPKSNASALVRGEQVFTTCADNQRSVEVKILQNEGGFTRASECKLVGSFELVKLKPAPAGTPQILISFNVDAADVLHVSAKDLLDESVKQTIAIKKNAENLSSFSSF